MKNKWGNLGLGVMVVLALYGSVCLYVDITVKPEDRAVNLSFNELPCRLPVDEGEELSITLKRDARGALFASCEYQPVFLKESITRPL